MSDLVKELESAASIGELFKSFAKKFPARMLYSQAQLPETSDGSLFWKATNYEEAYAGMLRVAVCLREAGVRAGDRVAIIAQTRPEWMIADIAILWLGAVSVSVYPTLTGKEIGYILFDSGARVVIAENIEQVRKLKQLVEESIEIAQTEERAATKIKVEIDTIVTIEDVVLKFNVNSISLSEILRRPAIETEPARRKREDLASLVYTSGTTGAPKGVEQTHGNHLSNVRQAFQSGMYNEASTIMLVLPLAHSFAKLMGYIGFIGGATLNFPRIADRESSRPEPNVLTADIAASKASVVPVVPRILEKIQEALIRKAKDNFLLKASIDIAIRRYEGTAHLVDNILFILTKPVRQKIAKKIFGTGFLYAISGGAKLDPSVGKFFCALEIPVLEGYGLTETCVATNVNRLTSNKIGTVGPVLTPDIQMKIAEDGEVLFRGPNIARGYWNRPAATQMSWDSAGWFHTGDLGNVDEDGYLSIIGRKKELIVTSGGKKIAPEPIESEIKKQGNISQVVLVGEGRPYCVALITLNESGRNNPSEAQDSIAKHLERVNSVLASFETVKRFAVLEEEFSIENNLLTPTLKVRRSEVTKRYSEVIGSMYNAGA